MFSVVLSSTAGSKCYITKLEDIIKDALDTILCGNISGVGTH